MNEKKRKISFDFSEVHWFVFLILYMGYVLYNIVVAIMGIVTTISSPTEDNIIYTVLFSVISVFLIWIVVSFDLAELVKDTCPIKWD